MDFDVDRCRRRPSCSRQLIYLDTSTFGALARGDNGSAALGGVLNEAIEAEKAICVGSQWHDDEAALLRWGSKLDRIVKTIRTYTLELRMKFDEELITRELFAAARAFSGEEVGATWEEAFRNDPDDPPLNPFQAKYRNERADLREHVPALLDEAEHERGTSEALSSVHGDLRAANLSWEEVAAANVDAQVRYLLAPLADPDFAVTADRRQGEVVKAWLSTGAEMGAGSPTRKYLRFARATSDATRLRDYYSAVANDPAGFCRSDEVRCLPVIRLFPFLVAALSVDGRRTKPQASDLHDLWHLTYGMSRCDIVTADKRSCQLARGRNLVPEAVELIEAHHLDEIAEAVARVAD